MNRKGRWNLCSSSVFSKGQSTNEPIAQSRPAGAGGAGTKTGLTMIKGLWNYGIKVGDMKAAAAFYTGVMGGISRAAGSVLGCQYELIRLGDTRLLLLDRAPYEELLGLDLPLGFLHVVYEVDDFEATVETLRRVNVNFIMEPQTIDTDFGIRKIAFFEAPDGIRTEVMEVVEDAGNS